MLMNKYLDTAASDKRFQKSPMGSLCQSQDLELETEQECKEACLKLGYPYLGSWNDPGDFPKCTFTEGLNKVCHFNESPSPERIKVNPKYAAICKQINLADSSGKKGLRT